MLCFHHTNLDNLRLTSLYAVLNYFSSILYYNIFFFLLQGEGLAEVAKRDRRLLPLVPFLAEPGQLDREGDCRP